MSERYYAKIVRVTFDLLLVIGGTQTKDSQQKMLNTTLKIEFHNDTWQVTNGNDLMVPRVNFSALLLPSGDVLVSGGQSSAYNTLKECELIGQS